MCKPHVLKYRIQKSFLEWQREAETRDAAEAAAQARIADLEQELAWYRDAFSF